MMQIRSLRPWSTILLLPLILACDTGEAEEAPTLQRATVTRGDLMITAEATGLVEPIREVEVKSKASGEILRRPSPGRFREGDDRFGDVRRSDFDNSIGKTVTVEASPARDGSLSGLMREITLADGQVVSVCPC